MIDLATQHGFTFDTVQMPLNVFDAHFESFAAKVIPVAKKLDMGILAMKTFGDNILIAASGLDPIDMLHYGMNLPTSVVITGIDKPEILDQAIAAATSFAPLSQAKVDAILAKTAELARDGSYERYKTSRFSTARFRIRAGWAKWIRRGSRLGCVQAADSAVEAVGAAGVVVKSQGEGAASRILGRDAAWRPVDVQTWARVVCSDVCSCALRRLQPSRAARFFAVSGHDRGHREQRARRVSPPDRAGREHDSRLVAIMDRYRDGWSANAQSRFGTGGPITCAYGIGFFEKQHWVGGVSIETDGTTVARSQYGTGIVYKSDTTMGREMLAALRL